MLLLGKYLNKYYLKYAVYFIIGVAALVFVDIIQLKLPENLGEIVGIFDANSVFDDSTKQAIVDICINTIIVAAGMFFGRVIWRFTIFRASQNIESSIRHDMFLKAEKLSISYYHDNKVGSVMAWFTNDLETIEEFLGWGTIMIIDALFLSIFVVIKMVTKQWQLSLILFIPVILIVIWGALVEKFMQKLWSERQSAYDELYDFSQETFTGIRVIKAFVKETQELHAFAKVARKNESVNYHFAKISVIFDVIIQVIIGLITALLLGLGGYIVYCFTNGTPLYLFGSICEIDSSSLIVMMGYLDTLIWPMIAMGQVVTMHSRSSASLKRITAFLDIEEDVKNCENPIILQNVKGQITFKDFNFGFATRKNFGLFDLNFDIKPGEKIGIVGKIGCGKSTLANLLLRFYNVKKGTLFIDGVDIMDIDITSLRNAVAYVPQDNFLFSDKIETNISFSDELMDKEKIIEAAKFADVYKDISDFKEGFETITGERGVSLSGGQKQRISIARAFAKDAPIFILDDSVSAVDVKTEETILENINKYREGKTTIVVASRISTVSHLDRILVLKDGRVEAFDSHENLLKNSETYAKMVYLQELEKEVEGGN